MHEPGKRQIAKFSSGNCGDYTTYSKGLIRAWAVEAMHMNSVLPAVLFLT